MREAHPGAGAAEFLELLRCDVAQDGQVLEAGPQILADGEYVHAARAQVPHRIEDFVIRLSQTDHQPRLGGDQRAHAFRVGQHV